MRCLVVCLLALILVACGKTTAITSSPVPPTISSPVPKAVIQSPPSESRVIVAKQRRVLIERTKRNLNRAHRDLGKVSRKIPLDHKPGE